MHLGIALSTAFSPLFSTFLSRLPWSCRPSNLRDPRTAPFWYVKPRYNLWASCRRRAHGDHVACIPWSMWRRCFWNTYQHFLCSWFDILVVSILTTCYNKGYQSGLELRSVFTHNSTLKRRFPSWSQWISHGNSESQSISHDQNSNGPDRNFQAAPPKPWERNGRPRAPGISWKFRESTDGIWWNLMKYTEIW